MPDFSPKKWFKKFEDTVDKGERFVTRSVEATYKNGRDIVRADLNFDQPPLPAASRKEARALLSRKETGDDRITRYSNAPDKLVMDKEVRAKRKLAREGGAIFSSATVAGGSAYIAAHTGDHHTSKLAFLKFSTAAKHTGTAANNLARASVLESERIRRKLPEPQVDYDREVEKGLVTGFVNRMQAEALGKLRMAALDGVDHFGGGEALHDHALDALSHKVPADSFAGREIAEARATPYAGPTGTPDFAFKQTTMSTSGGGETYMYTPTIQQSSLPPSQPFYTPTYTYTTAPQNLGPTYCVSAPKQTRYTSTWE